MKDNSKINNRLRARKIPYPFLAGVAISNDAEFMSADFFEGLMSFLNGTGVTPLGQGLGLEVTASMFFYAAHPYSISYFDGAEVNGAISSFAPRIAEYLKAGWVDTLHAYGDFDIVGGFVRAHAERAFDVLSKLNVVVPVFTNHGDAANRQNIGGDADYHMGDVPGAVSYHTDLLVKHGARFIWTDTATVEQLTAVSGGWRSFFPRRGSTTPSSITKDYQLQDGQVLKRFIRFRGTGINAPNLSSLSYQLDRLEFPKLYSRNGIAVIYQHLGVLSRSGGKCAAASLELMASRPEVYLAPWYLLSREVSEGRLWLAGLNRLLFYCEMIGSTTINLVSNDLIELKNDYCTIEPAKYFQGLTIYVPPNIAYVVEYCGQVLPTVSNGPDETGCYSISIPFYKLENIWHQ